MHKEEIFYEIQACCFGFVGIAFSSLGICACVFGKTSLDCQYSLFSKRNLQNVRWINQQNHFITLSILNLINDPRQKLNIPLD